MQERVCKKPIRDLAQVRQWLVQVWADLEHVTTVEKATDHWGKQLWAAACVKAKEQNFDTCCDLWRRTVFERTHCFERLVFQSTSAVSCLSWYRATKTVFVQHFNLIRSKSRFPISSILSICWWYYSSFDEVMPENHRILVFWHGVVTTTNRQFRWQARSQDCQNEEADRAPPSP